MRLFTSLSPRNEVLGSDSVEFKTKICGNIVQFITGILIQFDKGRDGRMRWVKQQLCEHMVIRGQCVSVEINTWDKEINLFDIHDSLTAKECTS